MKPWHQHLTYSLFNSLLLKLARTYNLGRETWYHICRWCHDDLNHVEDDHSYKYSLTNNFWIGAIPEVITCLTVAKKMLLALVYLYILVFKLHVAGDGGSEQAHPWRFQGSITSYKLNTPAIADMLEGYFLSYPLSVLASMITVTVLGYGQLNHHYLFLLFIFGTRQYEKPLFSLNAITLSIMEICNWIHMFSIHFLITMFQPRFWNLYIRQITSIL